MTNRHSLSQDGLPGEPRPSTVEDADVEKPIEAASFNKEGILHQGKLGPKPSRKHFFSSLDPAYAAAVHQDAEEVEYSEEEEVHWVLLLEAGLY